MSRRRAGRNRKLTPAQAAVLCAWAEAVQQLGTKKVAIRNAEIAWMARRRELGYLKQKVAEFGVSTNTLRRYIQGQQKP